MASFNHIMYVVSDMEEALKLWVDFFGFKVIYRNIAPDGVFLSEKLLDDTYGIKGAKCDLVLAMSPEGTVVEIQEPLNPEVKVTPKEYQDYSWTGVNEFAINVENIDEWYQKVVDAGYTPATDYIWSFGDIARSFLFHDKDWNLIQLMEVDPEKMAAFAMAALAE